MSTLGKLSASDRSRVRIEAVTPCVDGGRHAPKAVAGDDVIVGADILRDGHACLGAAVAFTGPSLQNAGHQPAEGGHGEAWREVPMRHEGNDRWYTAFSVDRPGAWRFRVVAWTDQYATWLAGLQAKHDAGERELAADLADGAALLAQLRPRVPEGDAVTLDRVIRVLADGDDPSEQLAAAADPALQAVLKPHGPGAGLRADETASDALPLWVDRERGRFAAWYGMFPRSEGSAGDAHTGAPVAGATGAGATTDPPGAGGVSPARSGTLAEAAQRLPAVAAMGFDVVYLPPVHPIGSTKRKGRGGPRDLSPGPGDPGAPWAIGSPDGGHDAIHPDLGTLADFDAFVAEAVRHGLEVAMDFAAHCSPDHPWVAEHPEWFLHRSDGSIAHAENPPKHYEDIYPLDFEPGPEPDSGNDRVGELADELLRVLEFWIARGVAIFRVDNPHTKPLWLWEWLIAEIHRRRPDVVFLAEAFTRPKLMTHLAKLGFTQSYTYFTWRDTKAELTAELSELCHGEATAYLRPHLWPSTPDILPEYLQNGGRAAFKVRLVLAALASPAYGVCAGYELLEATPLHPGSEEHAGSDKYRYRRRDWTQPDSLAPYIARINGIRAAHKAFRHLSNLWLHEVDDDALLCFSKTGPGRTDPLLVLVNLDPQHPREGIVELDLWQLGLESAHTFIAHDLLTDACATWHGAQTRVRLDPAVEPAQVLSLTPVDQPTTDPPALASAAEPAQQSPAETNASGLAEPAYATSAAAARGAEP